MCRDEQKIPSKSQIALALYVLSANCLRNLHQVMLSVILRFGIYFIQESTTITGREDAGEAPRLVLQRLNVLDLN
jgi:hypothetical protein